MRNWDSQLSEIDRDSTSLPLPDLAYGFPHKGKSKSACSWERDWNDVRAVCDHLGIPADKVKLLDFTREYWTRVFEPCVDAWRRGQTPNPDIMCNQFVRTQYVADAREIKFGALLDTVLGDKPHPRHFLATGHYAQVNGLDGQKRLFRAKDASKDQSYYLSAVNHRQLQRVGRPPSQRTDKQ